MHLRINSRLAVALFGAFLFACGRSSHPLDLDKSTLRITADNAVADGVQTVTIELVALDTAGKPYPGAAPTLTASGTGNLQGAWRDTNGVATKTPADGKLTTTLSSTKAEVKQLSASLEAGGLEGVLNQYATATFVAGVASGGQTQVTPPASQTTADGTSLALVTLVVKDAQGNPVAGVVVSASVDGATVNGPLTTNADGQVTFSVTSTHAGTIDVDFTTDSTPLGTAQVVFGYGLPAKLHFGTVASTVTAGQALPSFQVQVLDAYGNLVTNAVAPIAISIGTNPGTDQLGGTLSLIPSSGIASFTDVVLHKAGTGYTLIAGGSGFDSMTSSSFSVTAADPDGAHTLVVASGSPTVGGSQTVTVTVLDAYDNPVSGVAVSLAATGGASVSAAGSSGVNGTFSGTVTTTTSGPVTISAYLGATLVSQSPTVSFQPGAPAPGGSLVVAGASAVADGNSSATITVTVKDSYGNPIPGAVVSAAGTNGAIVDGPHTTGSDGTATFGAKSTTAGASTITFTSGGVTLGSGDVTFQPGAAAKLAFSQAPTSAVAGQALSQVSVRLLDAHGNLVTGDARNVTVSVASGPAGEAIAGTLTVATSSGTATFTTLVLHKSGSTTLSASGPELTGATSAAIQVSHADADASHTLVSAPAPTATAGGSVTITVTVQDIFDNAVPGQSVTLAASPDPASVVQPGAPSAGDGTVTGSISSTASGQVVVTAKIGSTTVVQTASVTFKPGAISPDQSDFSTSTSSVVADGSSSALLKVTARDAYGNAIAGKVVVFSATGTNTIGQGGPTNASGQAQGSIASTEAGAKTLTATIDGVVLAMAPIVTFTAAGPGAPSAANSTVVSSPATIQADGTTQSAIIVTVKDSSGSAAPGVTVTLALSSGTGTIVQPAAATDASGVATGHLSASAVGSGTVSATAGGVLITQTATVSYVKPITTTVPPKKVPMPVGVNCTTQYSNMGRKVTADQANNIYVVMNCGGAAYTAVSTDLGNTYSTAQTLGMTNIVEVATVGGPAGIAYALGIDSSGGAWFSRTTDTGSTWSTPVRIETTASSTYGATIAVDNDWVYVACNIGGTVRVFRNSAQGVGTFDHTDIVVNAVFGDILTDTDGSLWVTTDDPTFHILKSTDHGVTFGPESNPSGSANYSDWSIGNGIMWVTGTQTYATRIPSSAPGTSTSVTGLVSVDPRGRAVSADKAGNAYIISGQSGTGVTLQRALAAGSSFDAGRLIDASGTWPGVVAGPGNNTAILVYTVGTDVWASVQVY